MINRVLSVIAIFAISLVTMAGCNNMKFNNSINKNDLLTEEYSIEQIEDLKSTAQSTYITYSKFRKDFNVQCVRKTHQGHYVVLLLEDGSNAFVFFNVENKLFYVMIADGFRDKVEFQSQVKQQMPKSEVLKFDPSAIPVAVSAVEITAHIIQEGICIVKYSRFLNGKMVQDPIVTSIDFIENKSLSTTEDSLIREEIPFIFELDKLRE